ncbi:MAG: efflux RND transporter periplasmic adaptor subunit [Bacteroidetes bacterium]|nr:efflux RND transporter periplasmic adaptor subunit [Bacteroidota bacterium]
MNLRILPALPFLLLLAACSDGNEMETTFTGIMDANTVRVSAETPGRVLSLYVDEGDAITRDSVLAIIETERLGYQLDQNDAMMAELQHQLTASESRLRAARVQRDNVAKKYERFKTLLSQQAATQQMVDDLKTQLESTDDELAAAEAAMGALRSKRSQIESGSDIVRKQQRDGSITAPLTGRVLVRYTEEGEFLGIGAPLFDVANLRDMWTRIYVSEKQLPSVRLGQEVRVEVDGSDASFTGRVSWISDKAEFTPKTILTEETRTALVYPVKISVTNRDEILKIGMPVTVHVEKGA